MSLKKNKRSKSSLEKDNTPAKPSGSLKRIGLTVFWGAVLAVGLWALMDLSAPESNLVPYKDVGGESQRAG